jgi:glycosyltransferase involved in cell wall biosynthesis
MTHKTIALSIVIPVHNEEEALPALFRELERVRIGALCSYAPIEIVLVDDGSRDRSWDMIAVQCDKDPAYVGVKLSRNFGHQLALTAGLETARGDAVVSMDADLQDPPEVIPRLLTAHQQGYDVVYATRADRGRETWGKRVTAKLFYFVIEKMSGVPIPRNTGDFRLLSRRALAELSRLRESHRFLRGLVPWIGFPQTQITYDRGERTAGRTHYPWHKMIRLAFDGIASMSVVPLRLAYGLSLVLFGVFVGYIVYVLIHHFFFAGDLVPGWTSLMTAMTIFGTIQVLLLGVLGEYIGRIYAQVKQRPLYLVQEVRQARIVDEAPRPFLTAAGPELPGGPSLGRGIP